MAVSLTVDFVTGTTRHHDANEQLRTGCRKQTPACGPAWTFLILAEAYSPILPGHGSTGRGMRSGAGRAGEFSNALQQPRPRRAGTQSPGTQKCLERHAMRGRQRCPPGPPSGGDRLFAAVHGPAPVDLRSAEEEAGAARPGGPRAEIRGEFRHAIFQSPGQLPVQPGAVPHPGELSRHPRLFVAHGWPGTWLQ